MSEDQDKTDHLIAKLDRLIKQQEAFQNEINKLSLEIYQLKLSETPVNTDPLNNQEPETVKPEPVKLEPPVEISPKKTWQQPVVKETDQHITGKNNIEKFIGENLINKIGIAITVIGVGIGAKYAIEHQMLSPLTRIILGYLAGIALLGFAFKLKKSYENYSAVLLSGAMAILYFITYIAYSFYSLFPQVFTFLLMVIFTIFTVIAALHYNQQVIAHIGLVGAYGIPFLLSDGSGKVLVLFSYMAIINIGILLISIRKYWKTLYYSSFILTWLIFFSWYFAKYETDQHFALALIFIFMFFATFYATFLSYKLVRKEIFGKDDILLLLANSFIFFGVGFAILNNHKTGEQLLGIFTLANAILHFTVAVTIYKNKLADKSMFYMVAGLVLVFITIAIPVQLNGNWVTLFWVGEAALLFAIGRTQKVHIYELLSYPLMVLAFISIIHDWFLFYGRYYFEAPELRITPIFNIGFLTSLLFVAGFVIINFLSNNKKYEQPHFTRKFPETISRFIAPAILLLVVYFMFWAEIVNYWHQVYVNSGIKVTDTSDPSNPYTYMQNDPEIKHFRMIWIINYSLIFLTALSFLNIISLKNKQLGLINLFLNLICIAVFLNIGLFHISELRENYLDQTLAEYYHRGIFQLIIRYLSIAFAISLLSVSYIYVRRSFIQSDLRIISDLILHLTIIWIISSELLHWLDIADSAQAYKLGLSILWGSYSLFLISIGIWKKKKHLRIGAICLFGVTLIKLFFYDISQLSTISKTIVFVALGVLLLIISFLYNKYKNIISDEN